MSFEGYYQVVCKNRHYNEIDYLTKELYCDGKKIQELHCEDCGDELIWNNLVDCTNEDDVGRIEVKINQNGEITSEDLYKLLEKNE